MMTSVFLWTGFVGLTGALAWLSGWLCFKACVRWWKVCREFHWIVAWGNYKRKGRGYQAYLHLVEAIATEMPGDFYERLMLDIQDRRDRGIAEAEKGAGK